jgi:hypothetical protein
MECWVPQRSIIPIFQSARLWAVLLLLAAAGSLAAQPRPAPVRDPLMNLMLSAPTIDVDSPVEATASFDPPVIRPGDSATYRLTFNALEVSIEMPAKLPVPSALDLRPGAHGQMLHMAGYRLQPHTAFNYHVRPANPGQFTIPEFTVTVYGKPVKVPAAELEVATSAPAPLPPRLILDVSERSPYVSQSVPVKVLFPGSRRGVVQGLGQTELSGEGFLVDQGAVRQRIEAVGRPDAGGPVTTFVYETFITPIAAGKLSIFAQGFAAGNQFSGPVVITGPATIPGGPPQFTLLESEPLELDVRPLPKQGELPGFTGALGTFALGPTVLSTNVLGVGDTLKLSVRVFGDTNCNMARLVPPPPPRSSQWQVFPSSADATRPPPIPGQYGIPWTPGFVPSGFTTLNFTLIPLTAEAHETPAIPFSYFDPSRGAYADLTIPPQSVSVLPGAAVSELPQVAQSEPPPETEKEPALSGLATSPGLTAGSLVPWQARSWFPLVQLGPGVFFLGLWGWDRRRRYLEQHPDILLRRRARHALRRQWRALRRAGRTGDAPRFAAAAVNAMQVACAPHFPAAPRALVGHDVLSLLPETDREGDAGEVVRHVFAVTDASRFATAHPDAAQLLPLQPRLERVLEQLEEKL